MEEGPTIGAWLYCLTFKQLDFTFFELNDNSKGIEHIELRKQEDSSFFHFRTVSKAIIHCKKGSALNNFGFSGWSSILDLIVQTSNMSEISLKSLSLDWVGIEQSSPR